MAKPEDRNPVPEVLTAALIQAATSFALALGQPEPDPSYSDDMDEQRLAGYMERFKKAYDQLYSAMCEMEPNRFWEA